MSFTIPDIPRAADYVGKSTVAAILTLLSSVTGRMASTVEDEDGSGPIADTLNGFAEGCIELQNIIDPSDDFTEHEVDGFNIKIYFNFGISLSPK